MSDPAFTHDFVPRRGRPNASQVAAIERAILSTARHMFLNDGYDAVAMESVASVIGVSKGTLYSRYSAKESLFRAVIEDSVKNWSQEAALEPSLHGSNIEARLRLHSHTIARSLASPEVQAFQRLLLATRDRFPELSLAMYEVGYLHIVNTIASDIREAAESDGIVARDPDGIARMIPSAIVGWFYQESARGPLRPHELEQVADRIVDLLIAARPAW